MNRTVLPGTKRKRVLDLLTKRVQLGATRSALEARLDALDKRDKELTRMVDEASIRVNTESVHPKRAAEISSRVRAICGLQLPVKKMTRDQERLLVSIVVGRISRASKLGIYVRMNRFGNKKQVYWDWKLSGVLAIATGTSSAYPEKTKKASVGQLKISSRKAASQLASLANDMMGYDSSPLCSSDD